MSKLDIKKYQTISDKGTYPTSLTLNSFLKGILVNGDRWPITRMEWAEGETLCQFIKSNLHNSGSPEQRGVKICDDG